MKKLLFISLLFFSLSATAQGFITVRGISGGSSGSGIVGSGTQYRLAYYPTAGTSVSEAAAITAARALISDANGVPTHSATTATELGHVSGVTSAIQTQFTGKQATLVSATNIKTINGSSLLGSGDLSVSGSSFPTQQSHTSGATVTVSNQSTNIWFIVNPASTLAALTITMPATPVDGQLVEISFGGTVTSGEVVTALTVSANSGQTLLQLSAPTNAEAGEIISYRYKSSNTKWYRVN